MPRASPRRLARRLAYSAAIAALDENTSSLAESLAFSSKLHSCKHLFFLPVLGQQIGLDLNIISHLIAAPIDALLRFIRWLSGNR